ncbi:MAG TPA: hypothetical protein P5280_12270 [Cyclobacteriaceae bacterium]|nr:hypothetical protein [Cyclobacteriaceae bacterium]
MFNNVILLVGIAAIAGPMGYMVGGSGSPVISVALPAVFGLVAIAVGLFQPNFPSKEQLELFSALQQNASLSSYLESLKKNHERAPLMIGLALLTFGIVYLAGTILGTTARIHHWFAPTATSSAPPAFPWVSATKPVTARAALEWIALQDKLLKRGYSHSDIADLYSIQVSEWDETKEKIKRLEDLTSKSVNAPVQPSHQNETALTALVEELLKYLKSVNSANSSPFPLIYPDKTPNIVDTPSPVPSGSVDILHPYNLKDLIDDYFSPPKKVPDNQDPFKEEAPPSDDLGSPYKTDIPFFFTVNPQLLINTLQLLDTKQQAYDLSILKPDIHSTLFESGVQRQPDEYKFIHDQ